MDVPLAWLIAGFLLIIVELVTGTFYLLVLGIAGLVGAAVAFTGGTFFWQAIGAAIVAVGGVIWVRRRHLPSAQVPMPGLDFGLPTAFDAWVDKTAGRARVKYRDALWDARIVGDASGEMGEILYITGVDGNTLTVSKTRPS